MSRPFAVRLHRGQSRGEREAIDPNLIGSGEQFTNNIERLCAILECLEGRRDIRCLPDFQHDGLNAKRVGCGLDLVQFPQGRWIVGIDHDRQSAQTGDDRPQEFDPLACKFGRRERQSSEVAARARQTGNEATAKRIRHRRKHDRDDRGRVFHCEYRRPRGDNDIHLEPDKLGGDLRETLGASVRPANFDRDGATFDPIEFTEPLHKSCEPLTTGRRRGPAQEPDGRQLSRLLRARRERPEAAPPSSVMNSRRFIRSPRQRGRAASAALRGRAPWRS